MHKYITEIIGTFFLVLTVGLTGNPLAIGCALMVMVYMGGHISGAHYNPAVTLAVFLRGRLPASEVAPYMAAQLIGAVSAGLFFYVCKSTTFAAAPAADAGLGAALLVEVIFTFALALVVLNTATSRETEGNSYFGLAIGFTVVVAAFAGGGISGGAFNPAVGVGPMIIDGVLGAGPLGHIWLYIVGPLAGGALAAYTFRVQHPDGD